MTGKFMTFYDVAGSKLLDLAASNFYSTNTS